ncbi:unnamed protein product [Paramecium pentaurelia]|uniref:Protein kinase domain-containing protein n=1 Tax=Paramecium pentaurelia TaxID=43138 RepID=A0A8S1XMM2_9CILI|nr:unnamed protein product [Paramecium pentaurelia]
MNSILIANDGTQYQIKNQLGSGSFGTVYQVTDLSMNKHYACKIISKALLQKYNAEKMIRQEIYIQSTITHRNIVKVVNSFEDNYYIYIISEFCSRGTLKQPKIPYQEKEIFNITHSLMSALDCLHSNSIVHRDIKLENIFINEEGTYKLGDFGWATYIDKIEPVICGTTEYMPPEVVLKENHDFKVDSWSLGVLLYILVHTNYPFRAQSQSELIQLITTKEINVNKGIDEDLQILILALLTKDPQQRPTIQQLFMSKWIKKQMKLYNIFNKYENQQLKNKTLSKNLAIKIIDVNGSVKKCLADSQKSSLTQSTNTQISSSNNPCSPFQSKTNIDHIFSFKEDDNIISVPQPKFG